MNKKNIIFKINDDEAITIKTPTIISDTFRYDKVKIIYANTRNKKRYTLYAKDFIIYALRVLIDPLSLALKNNLKLDPSINKNIGYMWNEDLNDEGNLTYLISDEGTEYWIGLNYMLWETPGNHVPNITSWMYEKEGTFFFEITPNYPWSFVPVEDAKRDPNFKTFKQFMETYQPLVVTTIERSTLEQWYKQVQQLIPLIEANDSKYFIKQTEEQEN